MVAASAFTSGLMAVCSLGDRGRESRIVIRRSHDAALERGSVIVAVFARRSTTTLVVPAAVAGKRNVATSPIWSCDDCRLLPQVRTSLLSKSRAERFLSRQVVVTIVCGSE